MPKTTSFWDHPIATLEKALNLRKQIEALRKTEQDIMGGTSSVGKRRGRPPKNAPVETHAVKADGRKGKRSAAARANMAAAQKARWAARNGGETLAAPVTGTKKKRTMSPEARAKIAAAQRARWAKAKG
jgi:hypothetical protein